MVRVPEGNIQRGATEHRGALALALRTPLMATTLVSVVPREVVRCMFADCKLMQFRPSSSLCRRCHRPLDAEESARPGPTPAEPPSIDPSTEAGLKVAGQVKEIRRARHLSQRQLAGRMQVPRTYISKIENGKAIPTLHSLERLAAALGVDVRQLVRDTRSLRDEEVASMLADPFLLEIATLLPSLEPLHRSLFFGAVRDMATGHRRIA